MIFHRIVSGDVFEIYLNLQELICISKLTQQKCAVIPNNIALNYFDLSFFQIMGAVAGNCSTIDLSDRVCMFNSDLNTQSGLDLISKNNSTLFRLDKCKNGNIEIRMSKPNYYKDKYIFNEDISISLNEEFVKKYSFIANLLPHSNLLYLTSNDFDCPFSDCHYVSESYKNLSSFFEQKQIKAFDLKTFITNYHSSLTAVDFKALLLILKNNFTSVHFYPDCVEKWCLV
jgi:hypothetical protein